MRNLIFLLIVFALGSYDEDNCYNHEKDLVSIKEKYQKELDTGNHILLIEKRFNMETDSVLSLVVSEFEQVDRRYWHTVLKKDTAAWRLKNSLKLDSLLTIIENEVEKLGFASEIAQLEWYSTSSDYNYQKAMELNRIKLEMCNTLTKQIRDL